MWRVWEKRFGAAFLAIGGTIFLTVIMRRLDGWEIEWEAVGTGTILLLVGAWMFNNDKGGD